MWEIISGILGILGFLLSIYQLISSWLSQKRNLVFHLYSVNLRGNDNELIIRYRIDNLSEKPINVTRFQVLVNGISYDSNFISEYATESLFEENGKEIFYEVKGTDVMPIYIEANASRGGHISFEALEDNLPNLETPLNFVISTNRGKPIQMKLLPNDEFRVR